MENLNEFEFAIVQRVSEEYPILKKHIPFLRVRSRELTGVGMYINFGYSNDFDIHGYEIQQDIVSANEYMKMEGLVNGLNFEINASNGKLDFIELVTNGEDWDGGIREYKFVPIYPTI
jgi:hypothetical protein